MGIPKPAIEIAKRQGGYITRGQLVELGLSVGAIDRRVTAGDLRVVAQGTYRLFDSDEHVDLLKGAALALPGAVVSHQSAAHVLEFPRLPVLVPTVTVASSKTHQFDRVTVRRTDDLKASHCRVVDGLRVTGVARTAFDLGSVLGFQELDAIGESLVIAGRMSLPSFERLTAALARRGKPGSRAARDFIAIRSGTEPRATILERRGRAALQSAGMPAPVAQYSIPWDPGRRFDDAYPEAALALEWDSRAWHEQRQAMAADRRRDRDAAIHGWVVLRFTWEDVTKRPSEVAATVFSLLRQRQTAS